eukprot:PhF_6_TR18876/c1_g1_i2/m.27473
MARKRSFIAVFVLCVLGIVGLQLRTYRAVRSRETHEIPNTYVFGTALNILTSFPITQSDQSIPSTTQLTNTPQSTESAPATKVPVVSFNPATAFPPPPVPPIVTTVTTTATPSPPTIPSTPSQSPTNEQILEKKVHA